MDSTDDELSEEEIEECPNHRRSDEWVNSTENEDTGASSNQGEYSRDSAFCSTLSAASLDVEPHAYDIPHGIDVVTPASTTAEVQVIGTAKVPHQLTSSDSRSSILHQLRDSVVGKYFKTLEELHRSIARSGENKVTGLESLLKRVQDVMKSGVEGGNISLTFGSDNHEESAVRLLQLLIANQLFLAGGGSKVCLLCNKGSTIKCHVFPETLLRQYCLVHRLQDEFFIHDCITGENKCSANLVYRMFCGECDGKASPSEKKLKYLYLEVNENYPEQAKVYKTYDLITMNGKSEPGNWSFLYIIALMFLRGLIVNIDLLELSETSEHCDLVLGVVFELIEYAKNGLSRDYDRHPKIFQYLVPLKPINRKLQRAHYIYNIQRQSLIFTQFHEKDGGPFLYLQFDFFHWVLPLNSSMIVYLSREVDLGTKAMLTVENEITFYSEAERIHYYPEFLLHISQEQAMMLFRYILQDFSLSSQSIGRQVTDNIRAFIGLERIKTTVQRSTATWDESEIAFQPSDDAVPIGMTEEDHKLWTSGPDGHKRLPKPHRVLCCAHDDRHYFKFLLKEIKDLIENTKKRVVSEEKRTRHSFEQICKVGGLNKEQIGREIQYKRDELCSSFDEMVKAVNTASDTLTAKLSDIYQQIHR